MDKYQPALPGPGWAGRLPPPVLADTETTVSTHGYARDILKIHTAWRRSFRNIERGLSHVDGLFLEGGSHAGKRGGEGGGTG